MLNEFILGIVIGLIGGGTITIIFTILLEIVVESIYHGQAEFKIQEHNKYVEKTFNKFLKLRNEFFKLKKKLSKEVGKHVD